MKYLTTLAIALLVFVSCGEKPKKTIEKETTQKEVDLKIEFGKVAQKSVFSGGDEISIWGGSVVKGEDNLYHMFYSRWPKNIGWEWVNYSEVAHAVSKDPLGPYKHVDVALKERGEGFWDGSATHNPTVHKMNGKYYIYYMGNFGDKKIVSVPGKAKINWMHRNNQRVGVAVADSPNGPWKRFDKPVLDITYNNDDASDALMTSNPSVCQMTDGKVLLIYKAVGKKFPMPNGGPVVHMVAIAESPTGPFVKQKKLAFEIKGERFPAEDPYIWYQDGKYRAIVKRIKHEKQANGKELRMFSLVQYDSKDGLDWKPSKYHEISERIVTWENGRVQQFKHLERPQVIVENGEAIALTCAADTIVNKVRNSFNIQIPLKITKENAKK
ncbi:glycoside hydrolase family protein [Polaribacter sp. Z014]|uniref:glycoside hydrolase family protein n=1 Tax=Polaribacter sp. Z014 TaxID=2927126 RepID=UPI002020A34C|nr:glycoside hydrolase family protein [Polaribacter sp. Z014]MCL7762567.1 glycoside hydrolase family protein [Polaribacter sp. Z014]